MGWMTKKQTAEYNEKLNEAKKLSTIPSKLPTPIMVIDKDFNITYFNQHSADLVGLRPEQCVGRKCYDLFKTTHCRTDECRCAQAMKQDRVATGETVAHPNGQEIPIKYSGAPIKDENGNITGAVEYILDITEEKKAINDAFEKVNYLNNVPTPVMAIDKDMNVRFMNEAGSKVAGLTPENCVGKKCYDLFTNPHCRTSECRTARAMRENDIFTGDSKVTARGLNMPIQYTGAPIRNDEGKVIGGLEYVVDMTSIKNVVNSVNETAVKLSEGDLNTRASAEGAEGDYRQLVEGFNQAIDNILKPVGETMRCLNEMSTGNLTISVEGDYQGDHAKMKNATNGTIDSLNEILSQVAIAGDQVSVGAQQVSDSSQSLSQGATEQASSLEEVTSSLTELSAQTKQNSENALQANQLAKVARESADQGNNQMSHMLTAMTDINESSSQISKIIKAIDEIAFQTNLLALNAAVEAARAGVHGKGFAVVAEEVRNLAQRSAKAANETTDLIENSVNKVQNGMNIANETAKALEEIVGSVTKVTDLVAEISSASHEQAQGIDQVSTGLGQIDQVTQTNAANAEESASASEELSSQAAQLKDMIAKFRLKNMANMGSMNPGKSFSGRHESHNQEPKGNGAKSEWDNMHDNGKSKMNADLIINLDDDDYGKF
jgi:methyl-accepting chemotaxis protein